MAEAFHFSQACGPVYNSRYRFRQPQVPALGSIDPDILREVVARWTKGFDTERISLALNITESGSYRLVNLYIDGKYKTGSGAKQ